MKTYELYYTNWDEDIVARKEYGFAAADIVLAVDQVMSKQSSHLVAQEIDIEETLDRAMIDLSDGEKEFTLVIEPV